MFDAAFIKSCAEHSIPTGIVEQFIATVRTENPLAISITSGNRVILPNLSMAPLHRTPRLMCGKPVWTPGTTLINERAGSF